MEYIVHLTEKCNLQCKYCYENKEGRDLSFENIKCLIDNEINQKNKYCILTFYGGEPLLKKDIIKKTINYIKLKKSKTKFFFGITTNGTLLDDDFIIYMKQNNFSNICYSIDGTKYTYELNRMSKNEKYYDYDIVLNNAKKLLDNFNFVVAMSVITKNNLENVGNNVEYLINIGFKYINLLLDYTYNWKDEDLGIIRQQLYDVADIYSNKIINEDDIDIPLLDSKIKTYINDKYNCNDDCKYGMETINVGTDGNFYPCMQFVGNSKFVIGNCKEGININLRRNLIEKVKKENEICKGCAIKSRCKHMCGCRNLLLTGDINKVSPINCEIEKIIVEVADSMAEKLYRKNSKMFIQKYYNKNYNILKQFVLKKERNISLFKKNI